MSESVYAGLTSQTVDVFLGDSSSTTGGGLTGLVYNSAGLTCYYRKGATGTPTAITLATQTVGGAWSSGGFKEVDSTNMPGVYRFDIPNAAVDTEGFVTLYFRGATNLVPTAQRVDCRALPADLKTIKTQSVTCAAGVTVSPYVGSTGAAVNGTTVNTLAGHDPGTTLGTSTYAGADTAGTTTLLSRLSAARAGYLDFINNSNLASVPAFPTNFSSLGIAVSGKLNGVILVDTTTTNTDMITQANVRTAVGLGSANLDSQLSGINNKTTNLPSDPASETTATANKNAVLARLGTPAGASVSADIAAVLAKWTTAVTESYAADGSAPTPEQALMMILQSLHEFAISGTTRTVKKLDGSTTAMTFTLDDASAPTSTTRAS